MCWQRQKFNEKCKRVCISLWLWCKDQQNFLHGKGPISCHKLPWAFVPGPPSQSIVSWAGESRSWPLWGVFQAPHITFFCFVHMNSTLHRALRTVAHRLKDTGKQGKDLNAAKWYTVLLDCLLCSTIVFCIYIYMHIYVHIYLVGGRRGWLFVCEGWSKW